ncbi:MAG: MoxR family ATPase [Lachnospiraceae bacterium]|nr:MoxR family ATPase [Lachnospiraceae bacterium]
MSKSNEEKIKSFREQMNSYFTGKQEIVEQVLCCFLAGGHVLLEDVPGVGKTTLARCFAKSLGLSFGRIQFTPDTMPGDVTGLSVYNMKSGEFAYREGAVMKNIVLADELNRTSPKTQSALLEAMAEARVTVDGTVHPLPDPFMVIATQNPASFMGTYPLPEAQLDRFMMRLSIGYPDREEELRMARERMEGKDTEDAEAVLSKEDVVSLRSEVEKVRISDKMYAYTQQIIAATRTEGSFSLGASPRALLQLLQASRAAAFLEGRDFVKPDDVKGCAVPVLSHRLIRTTEMRLQKKENAELLKTMLLKIKVPMD